MYVNIIKNIGNPQVFFRQNFYKLSLDCLSYINPKACSLIMVLNGSYTVLCTKSILIV